MRAITGGESPSVAGQRLAALRRELRRRRLTGFVVPRSDEHQGEYVAPAAERLAWLTGFTGSAGCAVVLPDLAAVFVDGRYTVQAEAEVNGALYALHHIIHHPPAEWIAQHLPSRGRLGYDPWLHTPSQIEAFAEACRRCGGRVVPVESNPIDTIWHDRPAPPASRVVAHPLAFAGASSATKRQTIAADLAQGGEDAAILSAPDAIAWLLNIRGSDVPFLPVCLAFAIIHADARVECFLRSYERMSGLRHHLSGDVAVSPMDRLGAALDQLGARQATVRCDPDGTPLWIVSRLQKAGATPVHAPDPCALPKAAKNPAEVAGMRAAHVRDGVALTRFLAWLAREAPRGEVREMQAAEQLAAFRAAGALYKGPSFPTISAAGAHAAIVHYRASRDTDHPLAPGSLYLVDSGGQYLDGTTDVTRTVAIGQPTDEMRNRFTLVLKGHIALARTIFPCGTTGSQIDAVARLALWRSGLDYDHGTGHGVGSYLNVHEGPQRLSKLPNRIGLRPGMILSNEPGYYKPGEYGIRIENLVLVGPVPAPPMGEVELLGFDTLTLAPIDRTLICRDMMQAEEIRWLNSYHAKVLASLLPLLDADTANWLIRAAAPIE